MPVPLETAATTYREMAKIVPHRFRNRRKAKPQLPNEMEDALVLAATRAGTAVQAVRDIFFEPANPFDSQATRHPRRGVALFCGLAFTFVAVFAVSSFVTR